jgi:hypothetical protein
MVALATSWARYWNNLSAKNSFYKEIANGEALPTKGKSFAVLPSLARKQHTKEIISSLFITRKAGEATPRRHKLYRGNAYAIIICDSKRMFSTDAEQTTFTGIFSWGSDILHW